MGFATPEATLETFLWAVRNRDLTNLVAGYAPEAGEKFLQQFERSGKSTEKFFDGSEALPGMNIVEKNVINDDTVELIIEMVPGAGAEKQPATLRRINGEWKLEEPGGQRKRR